MSTIVRNVMLAVALLALATIASIPSARAGIITQTNTISGQTRHLDGFGDSFQQFNPVRGTLNAVTVDFSGSGTFSVDFALDPNCPFLPDEPIGCSAFYNISIGLYVFAPGLPDCLPGIAVCGSSSTSGILRLSDTSPFSDDIGLSYTASPLSLSPYIGLGLVPVGGAYGEDSDECDNFGLFCTLSDNVTMTTTLTYNYTPVPEPFTVTLFGAGLVGAAAMRRRKKTAA